ncbi:MAG: hypothetical protein RL376_1565 [Verrucomicrobiota bacterium]
MRVAWQKLCVIAFLGLMPGWSGCELRSPAVATAAGTEPARPASGPTRPAAREPRIELVWPVPNKAYLEGKGLEAFIQPTESGETLSGTFGSVRSAGRQFHEGLDLFPLKRDARGEALDEVVAAMAGVVRHVNKNAGASSYGRYVVMEHPEQSPPVYTLYAHLAEIDAGVRPGGSLAAGARVARMGRSAGGYTIPKERAHLHFEIGLRLTDRFQAWYDSRGFGSRNEQGLYNGMNLMGIDPLAVFTRWRAGGLKRLDEVFRELPAAVTLRIARPGEPDFLRRYPSLAQRLAGGAAGGGWEIDCTATGVPVRWRQLPAGEFTGWRAGEVRIVASDEALLKANRGRELVTTRKGRAMPGDDLHTMLEQVFGAKSSG